MLECEAVVIAVEPGLAHVETARASACGSCASKDKCGSTPLMGILGIEAKPFVVRNTVDARVGERVIVGLEGSVLLKSSFLAYILPLALLVAGAVVGALVTPAGVTTDGYAAGGALLGLIVGFAALHRVGRDAEGGGAYRSEILRRALSCRIVGGP